MKLKVFLVFLLAILASGCATKRSVMMVNIAGPQVPTNPVPDCISQARSLPRFSLTPAAKKIIVKNGTAVYLLLNQNSCPVYTKDSSGVLTQMYLLPGKEKSFDYYVFMGSIEVVLTADGFCPIVPSNQSNPNREKATSLAVENGCAEGQFLGSEERQFTVYSSQGRIETEIWTVTNIRAPVMGAR